MSEETPKSLENIAMPSGFFDVRVHRSGVWGVVEIERAIEAQSSSHYLADLKAAAAAFEHATDMRELFDLAAFQFRRFIGFDRVMIYRFLDDEAGLAPLDALLRDTAFAMKL